MSTRKMGTNYVTRRQIEKKRQGGFEYIQRRERIMKREKEMENRVREKNEKGD